MSLIRTHFNSIRTGAFIACVLALTGLMLYSCSTCVIRAASEVIHAMGYSTYVR